MITNKIEPTPILYGEDAKRFEEALENPKPVSKEELEQAKEAYKTFRKMGMYTVDDLKCCGNCYNFDDHNYNSRYFCWINNSDIPSNVCDQWKFDGLIKEDRKQ